VDFNPTRGLPPSRFHDLRHAAATFALSQGFTLEDVKNLLGHSSIVLTSNMYGHVLEQRQTAVAKGMDAVLGGSTPARDLRLHAAHVSRQRRTRTESPR
jgi:integrase